MDSKILIKNGFKKFGLFTTSNIRNSGNSELNFSGVYSFVIDKKFDRLTGKTDILYIGQAGSRNGRPIVKRMWEYIKAYKSAPQDKRISDSIKKIETKVRIGKTLRFKNFKNNVFLLYKEMPQNLCKKEEARLLNRYSKDHIELPPLNRQG